MDSSVGILSLGRCGILGTGNHFMFVCLHYEGMQIGFT